MCLDKWIHYKLPINPFKTIEISPDEKYVREGFPTHPQLTNEKLSELGCSVNPPYIATLCKIQYTDKREKLDRKVYSETYIDPNHQNGNRSSIERKVNIENIGVYKSKQWEFQNEYRYKFIIVPWTFNELKNITFEDQQKIFNRLITHNLSFDYIDLELDHKKMKDMEITIGPRANLAQKQIIYSLVNDLNPNAHIKESNLKIR